MKIKLLIAAFAAACLLQAGLAMAKSAYVIANINANPSPIQTYNINPDGTMTYQATQTVPYFGWGAVGLAIDTDSETLFVTYEQSNTIQLVDARTFADLGHTTAPGATNLAGIVVDQDEKLIYTVDRNTARFYVYDWDALLRTLTLKPGFPINLATARDIWGIALDEVNDLLYVADGYSFNVISYHTGTWAPHQTFRLSHRPVGIAVDPGRDAFYTGAAATGDYNLIKYDLNSHTETRLYLGSGIGVMGLGVDLVTGLVYASTGHSGDDFRVYDTTTVPFTLTYQTGRIGNPTGVAIPGRDISFNPLNLSKDDGLNDTDPLQCIASGQNVTYDICFDNALNLNAVNNVSLVDNVPAADVSFDSASAGGIYDPVTETVTWAIGTLPAGAAQQCEQLTLTITAAPDSTIINQVTIDSDETAVTTTSDFTNVCAQQAVTCDANNDGAVDITDIRIIGAARGSSPGDPSYSPTLDIDNDGVITVLDARLCVLQCDNPRCAP